MEHMYHCEGCNQDVPKGFLHKCPSDRDPLLVEREKTHGSFREQGAWAHDTKSMVRAVRTYTQLTQDQKEALDMIITKISRLLHGNAQTKDTWDDIAGYAKLGAEACNDA